MEQALAGAAVGDAPITDHAAQETAAQPRRPHPLAAETRRLYAADWEAFAAWSSTRQHCLLPAHPDTVAAYLASLSTTLSAGALARRAAAIADRHRRHNLPSPVQDERVRSMLRTARDARRAALKNSVANRWNGIEHARLRTDALRLIWRRRAAALRPTAAPPASGDRAEDVA